MEVASLLDPRPPGALCGKGFSQVYPTGEWYGLRSGPLAADRKVKSYVEVRSEMPGITGFPGREGSSTVLTGGN